MDHEYLSRDVMEIPGNGAKPMDGSKSERLRVITTGPLADTLVLQTELP